MKRRHLLQGSASFVATSSAGLLLPKKSNAQSWFNLGWSHNVYVANNTSETIYVLPTPNPDWVGADIAFDTTLLVAGLVFSGGASAATATKTVGTLNTIAKIKSFFAELNALWKMTQGLRNAASLGSIAYSTIGLSWEELKNKVYSQKEYAINFLKESAVSIAPYDDKKVFDRWSPTRFITLSDVSAMLGARTLNLFVVNESLTKSARFNTNTDYSWIVNPNTVVRSKYGSIWQENWSERHHKFSKFNSITSTEELKPDESLTSNNGEYEFIYGTDGIATVWRKYEGQAIWRMDKNHNAGKVFCDEYGYLNIVDSSGKTIEKVVDSPISERYPTHLTLRDDGNLVVQKSFSDQVLWDSF